MAKTADEFLNDLAERDLVPAEMVANLRRQVAKSATPVTATAIAKLLTDKGQLTAAQAQRLLGAAQPTSAGSPAKTVAKTPARPTAAPAGDAHGLTPLDEGLAPLDDGGLQPLDNDALAPLDGGLMPLDGGLAPLEEIPVPVPKPATAAAAAKPQPQSKPKPAAAKSAAQSKSTAIASPPADLAALGGLAPLDDLTQPAAAAPTDLLSDANLAGPLATAPATQPAAQASKKKSSLGLVLGLMAVLVLIGGGVAAFFLVSRGTGDAEFDLAAADFQAKSYDAAIAKFDAALTKYPASPRAALARVQRGAAQVLAARAQSPRDWQPVLAAAKASLPPIGGAGELSQVHAELAPLLTEMAVALAAGAKSPETAVPAREALALADDGRFVPGSLRDWQKLAAAGEMLARLDYDAQVAQGRDAAVAAIKKAIDERDIAAVLAERAKLRGTTPQLLDDAAIAELGPSLAQAAAAKAQSAEYAQQAESAEPREAVVGEFVLLPSDASAISSGGSGPKVVVAAGTAWGLNTATGAAVWRRPVGAGPAGAPVSLTAAAESDWLLVDAFRNELLRVSPATGALRWRHPLPGPAAGPPLVVGERVIVTTRAGQVLALDAASGHGKASIQLPQGTTTSAAVDPAGKLLYQVADDSLIYFLAAADLRCTGAAYLGHEPASVNVAPAVLARHVVIAVNRLPASVALFALPTEGGGLPPPTMIAGLVTSALAVQNGKVAVATDQGRLLTFESAADPSDGLKQVAAADIAADATARPVPTVPLAGVVATSADSATIVSASGSIANVKLDELQGFVAKSTAPLGKEESEGWRVAVLMPLAGGGALLVPTGRPAELRVLAADSTATKPLPLPGQLAASPLLWRGGIVVACSSGAIAWIDPATGALQADPFQLNLQPGERLADCRLATCGAGGNELIVAQRSGALHHLVLATDPQPQLVELAAAKIESAITGLAGSEKAAGVLDRRGQWHTFALPGLSPAPAPASFGGRSIVTGPVQLGGLLVLATDHDEIVGMNQQLEPAWKTPFPHGSPAGNPVVESADAASMLVFSRNGWLSRIALDSGKELAAVDLAQPLAGNPLVIGQFALVPAADGTLLKVSLAALEAPQP